MTMNGCESWTVKKTDRKKKLIYLKYSVGEELCEQPELPEKQTRKSWSKLSLAPSDCTFLLTNVTFAFNF